MMAGGIVAIEAPVDHVRNPGEGVPVGDAKGGECPLDALGGYAVVHIPVLPDIVHIVVGKETVMAHALKGEEGR